ncbi:ecotin [Chryseobacterium indologenes]|uniref:Ecotin n=1 Tax=Chryseobacterium indologenes TaxID=253 RepID=A0A411DPS3_CHRID|nr:ecotin [Chryseobacterium indologenes]
MKNKKLFELSKKITENKIPGMKRESVQVIKGGIQKEIISDCACFGANACWGYGTSPCALNSCWAYFDQ